MGSSSFRDDGALLLSRFLPFQRSLIPQNRSIQSRSNDERMQMLPSWKVGFLLLLLLPLIHTILLSSFFVCNLVGSCLLLSS